MRRDCRSLGVFLAAWVLYSAHFATNVVREHYPAFSLAERGTLRVDPYLGLHDDIFLIKGRGAFINNNPGASMLGAVPYLLTRPVIDEIVARVARERAARDEPLTADYDHPRADFRDYFSQVRALGLDVRFGLAALTTTVLLMAPLSALAILVMRTVLERMGFPDRSCLPLALLYGFGTPVFFRTAFLNQNLLVAHFALLSFACLLPTANRPPDARTAGAAGLFAGLALLCDYSAVVVVPLLGVYCFYLCMRTSPHAVAPVVSMVALAAIPVGILLAYQAWAFGNPFLPAQHYMPPADYNEIGWNSFAGLDPELLYANLLDLPFGLIPAAPVLLLALGVVPAYRSVGRYVSLPVLVLALSMFLGCWMLASATQFARWQWQTGVRYLVPAVPFLFLPTAAVLVALPRAVAVGIASLAVLHAWAMAMVREDPLTSLVAVATSGPQLPWLTTLGRMGDQYGSVASSLAANPTVVVIAVTAVPLTLLWRALRAPAAAEGARRKRRAG